MTKQKTLPPIPDNFPKWCEANGITPEVIARETGCSVRTGYRIVNGETKPKRAVWQSLWYFVQGA